MMLTSVDPSAKDIGWVEHYFNVTGTYMEFYLSADIQPIEREVS